MSSSIESCAAKEKGVAVRRKAIDEGGRVCVAALGTHLREGLKVALKVGAPRLRARADRHRLVLKVLAGRLRLKEVRARLVGADDEEAHAVWPPARALRANLRLVGDLQHKAADLHRRVVDVAVVDALGPHVLGERARVRH